MVIEMLSAALEREHREIDEGVEAFLLGEAQGAEEDAGPLRQAMDALRRHIYLEEEFLFPPLRDAGMVPPVFVMLREHGQLWDTMDVLSGELDAATGGARRLAACQELVAQLNAHNAKEEQILYPQADAVLTASAREELETLLASGRMPPEWVCERARP